MKKGKALTVWRDKNIAKCVIITVEKNPINCNVNKEKHKRKFSKFTETYISESNIVTDLKIYD